MTSFAKSSGMGVVNTQGGKGGGGHDDGRGGVVTFPLLLLQQDVMSMS